MASTWSHGDLPVRFPSAVDPGGAGWHVDTSFDTETPDFMSWRANRHSKGRALLMLFLFSDVGEHLGGRPRFLAQPPLLPVDPDNRPSGRLNPVEQATALGLSRSA